MDFVSAPGMMRSKERGGRMVSYDRYEDDYDYRRRERSYSRSPRRLVKLCFPFVLIIRCFLDIG